MKRIDDGPVYALTDGTGYSIHHRDDDELDEPLQEWTVPPDRRLLDDMLFEDLRTAREFEEQVEANIIALAQRLEDKRVRHG